MMATTPFAINSDYWKNLDQHLNLLLSPDKQVRRNVLNNLLKEVTSLSDVAREVGLSPCKKIKESGGDSDDDDDDVSCGGDISNDKKHSNVDLPSEITSIIQPLFLRLSDTVEKIRELTYSIITILISSPHVLTSSTITTFLPHIIPILLDRLGGQELVEPSEEIRLLAVKFMSALLDRMGSGLAPFIDDWLRILSVTLTDPFSEVRKSTCSIISTSATTMSHVFHYNSERLNKPLVASLAHQQSKLRVMVVRCIGDVLLCGNPKVIEDFILPLTLRLFDPQPNVRLAVVEVVGKWMLDFVDRYSYFHKLLPVLMTGLCDECDTVSETGYKLWEQIGEKYLEENLQDYKDQVDFPSEMPTHYPDDVKRPPFGCRLLTQRHVGKIIPGVTNDITDWVDTTRQKCAQLLFHLILNCESAITMHAEPVLSCIFKSCMDPSPIVSSYVLRSATLLGYFVPFPITWAILSTRLLSNPTESSLAPIASILQATQESILKGHIVEVSSLLANSDVCHTLKSSRQYWLVQVCAGLTKQSEGSFFEEEEFLSVGENVFRILLCVLAMTQDGDVKARAIVGLNALKTCCSYDHLDDLFTSFCCGVLQDIKASDSLWGPATPENLIFAAILTHGGCAVQTHLSVILDILVKQLDPSKDAEVRLNLFTLLSNVLYSYAALITTTSQASHHQKKFEAFVTTIVHDILAPNLIWRAGKSASALRASATSCLLIILEEKLLSVETYVTIAPSLTSGCLSLLEEGYELNRLLASQCLGRMAEACQDRMGIDLVHKIYPELLKRLDDEKDEVRVSAGLALARIFANLPQDRDDSSLALSKPHLEFVSSALLLHLDDDSENVGGAVAEALKSLGPISPNFLIEKCNEFKGKHRSPDYCENLAEYFETLNISNQ